MHTHIHTRTHTRVLTRRYTRVHTPKLNSMQTRTQAPNHTPTPPPDLDERGHAASVASGIPDTTRDNHVRGDLVLRENVNRESFRNEV